MTSYQQFLEAKIKLAPKHGFEMQGAKINPILKPHQRAMVQWAVQGGRRAIFASFGLGKSIVQMETLRIIQQFAGGDTLIVLPLGVRQEFRRDGSMLGMEWKFIRSPDEREADQHFYLTNYETVRDGKLDPSLFTAVSLDEASVLRGFGGTKTFREFMRLFANVRYRFVATATPSPNEYIELLAYSAFLGVMDVGEGKTRFFQRDSEKNDNLTLYPHKEREFWLWVASWALFVQKPSDLGFSDDGYSLPPLTVRWHEVPTDHSGAGSERDGQLRLLRNAAIGVTDAAKEKRQSLSARIDKLTDILMDDLGAHRLIWHDLEDERRAIEAAVPGVVSVYGSQDLDEREQRIIDFSDGKIRNLAAKPRIAGSGCNFQRFCHKAVFLGVGYKFNDFIQAIHRIQRFLQDQPVEIDIIYSEAEQEIRRALETKWKAHDAQARIMGEIIREFGLASNAIAGALQRSIGVTREEITGERFRCIRNDCVFETSTMPEDSVGLIVTSIPFSTQYEYTPSYNDFGHTDDDRHFWTQMDYLVPNLLRVLKPGRVAAIHVKDRITPGGINGFGFQTVTPFSDHCIESFTRHGFAFLARKTIVTDVVRENAQTYRLGWTEQCKDGSRMGAGMPEYLLIFRKPPTDASNGYADDPVVKLKHWWLDAAEGTFELRDPRTDYPVDAPSIEERKRRVRSLRFTELGRAAAGVPFGEHPGKVSLAEEAATKGYSRARWQIDAHGFRRSSGNRLLAPAELLGLPADAVWKVWKEASLAAPYNYAHHVEVSEALDARGALPKTFMLLPPHSWHDDVWTDVARMRTLNGAQSASGREMHICPLQFDIVEPAINQYSMPGETVLDPFGGLMTVPYCAIKLGRKGLGIELNPDYFRDGVRYCEAMEQEVSVPTLFDLMAPAEAAE